jgi:uncharacterized protein YecE (DUF72 family)
MSTARTVAITSDQPIFFVGTSGWTYGHWKGRFYPPELPQKKWFDFYARIFLAVEVNATFYRTFKEQTYHNWRLRAPQGFGYVLKASRLITHRKYLVNVGEDIRQFFKSCMLLEDKFEMILLQVAPNMPVDQGRLREALTAFPDPSRVAVEFRRADWLKPEVMSMLESLGVTICNVDSPQQRLTDWLTSQRSYLRLHGRNRWYASNYSDDELRGIAQQAETIAHKGARRIYIFFNNDLEGYAPANARTLQSMLKG